MSICNTSFGFIRQIIPGNFFTLQCPRESKVTLEVNARTWWVYDPTSVRLEATALWTLGSSLKVYVPPAYLHITGLMLTDPFEFEMRNRQLVVELRVNSLPVATFVYARVVSYGVLTQDPQRSNAPLCVSDLRLMGRWLELEGEKG